MLERISTVATMEKEKMMMSGVPEVCSVTSTVEAQKDASRKSLILFTAISLCAPIASGLAMAFPVFALTVYQDSGGRNPDNPLVRPLDTEQGSWFVSIMQLFSMCGLVSGGLLSDRFGRKKTLLASNTVLLTGWAIMYFANTFPQLLLGRAASGFGSGINMSSNFLLLNEITLVRWRGAYGNLNAFSVNLGFLFGLLAGGLVPFQWSIPICSLPCCLFLATSFYLPESPLWLVKQGHESEAVESIKRIRGEKYQQSHEVKELIMCTLAVVAQPKAVAVPPGSPGSSSCPLLRRGLARAKTSLESKLAVMTSPDVWKPMLLMMLMFSFQGFCGGDSLSLYSVYIFKKSNVALNGYVLSVLLQVGFTLGYVVSVPFMGHVGRRPQYFVSSVLLATAMVVLGASLYALGTDDPALVRIAQLALPFSCVAGSFAYGIGVGPVIYAVNGEVFPPSVKGICSATALLLRDFSSFAALKTFPALETQYGMHTMFVCHGFITYASCVAVFLLMPETKGLTLTELTEIWSGGKNDKAAPVDTAAFDLDPGIGFGGCRDGGILAVRSCPNFSLKLSEDDDDDEKAAQNCEEKSPMIV